MKRVPLSVFASKLDSLLHLSQQSTCISSQLCFRLRCFSMHVKQLSRQIRQTNNWKLFFFFISVFPRQILISLLSRNLTTTVTFESLGYLWLTMHFLHGRRYLKRCVTNAISPESKTRGAELFALVYQARFHCILYFLGKITIQIKFWYSQLTKLRRLDKMSERPLHVIVARRGGIKRW